MFGPISSSATTWMSPPVERAVPIAELPVGGAADREGAGERARPHRRDAPPLGESGRDRRAALRLRTDQPGHGAVDEAEPGNLAEALRDLRVESAGRDRSHDHVGQLPAELLGDLVAERLRALGVVGAQADVDEAPRQLERELDGEAAAVVVGALDGVDRRAVDGGRDQLLGLEVGRAEHGGLEPLGGGARRDRVGEVPGRRAGQRVEPELLRLRAGDRDDAILERVRRIGRVELQVELAEAERGGQPRRAARAGSDRARGAARRARRRAGAARSARSRPGRPRSTRG